MALPKEWIGCPNVGIDIIANKFVVCKTPLSDKYDGKLLREQYFKPQMVFDFYKIPIENQGLWIDLTNTDRYFHKRMIMNFGWIYKKLSCVGHYKAPTKRLVDKFIDVVEGFTKQHPTAYVVVHCTHGFNRTGFCIVSYLVKRLSFEVGAAVKLFANLRPPGIYKDMYIKELFRRYGDVSAAPTAPPKPQWCVKDSASICEPHTVGQHTVPNFTDNNVSDSCNAPNNHTFERRSTQNQYRGHRHHRPRHRENNVEPVSNWRKENRNLKWYEMELRPNQPSTSNQFRSSRDGQERLLLKRQ